MTDTELRRGPIAAVIDLSDELATDPAIAGTKGAGLAELRRAGFDVPDGIVLPVGIAAAWSAVPAPGDLRDVVASACDRFGGPFAVRSSATWEDSASHAHAGITTTVLDVDGVNDVLAAVRRCLDETSAAATMNGAQGDLAIVIQRLVPADWAGVAFTADPLSGERNVVRIAATTGLGEALVQGDVIGEDIIVRGDSVETTGDGTGRPVLPAEHIRAIAECARRVEAHFGAPQDIEWAIADGELRLLQARPITVLPIEPIYPEGNNWQKDVAHYPEPLTPFGWSILEHCSAEVPKVFDDMGLLVRGLEEACVGGEVYGRVLPAFGSPNAAGSPPPAPVLGLVARIAPPLRKRTALARHAVDTDRAGRWLAEWFDTQRADTIEHNAELWAVDLTALDDRALAEHAADLLDHALLGYRIHFRLLMPLARAMFRLNRFVSDELGWDDAETMSMLAGHSPATRAPSDALDRLRRRVAATPGPADAIVSRLHDPVRAIAPFDPDLADAVATWLDHHGWAMVNYDAGVAVLAERGLTIGRLLLASPSDDTDGAAEVGASSADEVAGRARSALPEHRRAEFDRLLDDARTVYGVREDNTIIVGDRPFALLRRWMLEAAGRLEASGALSSKDAGAYLTLDELRSALTAEARGLDDIVRRRRGEEAWVRANPGPAYIGKQGSPPDVSRLPAPLREVNEPILWMISHEYPTPSEPPTDADVLVTGVPAAAGSAEGTARVILSHTDLHLIEEGDVLVCQVTSPAWAPFFDIASAVVADGGGVLSHAAIAAREAGIPAVLGTGDATARLTDGQRVRVDGTGGIVSAAD